ncbi:Calmodulin and related proteins (EF-Hand superfamily) [Handroanthus impetiginosus]|uniref:Calmodulin and related proteins (EF-Hand superfamily) n=1 Tax=Handroanthus impetiginosus TaxID=429701 RepID=A0A2G9HPC2_9LAMI|nr:Calmodulin and related proteins (EF-Hand superfamily) [Handroanthus impetiginosus]
MEKRSPSSTSLTLEEEVEKVFSKFDANGDGRISMTELGAILNGLGSTTPADEVARIMSELDTDGDGFIDLNEFKAFHCGGSDDNNKELREAFDLYDKDKNGKISVSELHSVLRSLGEKCSLKDCRRMISSVDVDGDGCVNFEEFKKMMTRAS